MLRDRILLDYDYDSSSHLYLRSSRKSEANFQTQATDISYIDFIFNGFFAFFILESLKSKKCYFLKNQLYIFA